RRDEAAQADQMSSRFPRGFKDLVARDHYSEVNHFVIVAAQDDADDIFADIVDVAFHGGHDDTAFDGYTARLFFRFQIRLKIRDRFLHHPRALDDLRQKHAPRSEEIAHHVHRIHE